MKYSVLSLFLAAIANGSNILQRQTILGTSTVNLSNNTGSISHLASGILYGIPDTQGQIPTSFYSEMGFNYARAGGAQVPSPGRGWIWGLSEYKVRFASALSNYQSTRAHGGKFIFLIHDLWGADVNEPDLTAFWNRSQAQYFQLWGRTYYRLRAAFPNVPLIGPAYAGWPSLNQWVWHMEGGDGDMGTAYSGLQQILSTYGLPQKTVNIDEYGTNAEQVPSVVGHFTILWQVFWAKPDAGTSAYSPTATGYWPNGEWQVYKYYNLNMTGHRVRTSASADTQLDTYATVGSTQVKILCGSSVGLPTSGTLNIHTWGFPNTGGTFGSVLALNDLGTVAHAYSGNRSNIHADSMKVETGSDGTSEPVSPLDEPRAKPKSKIPESEDNGSDASWEK
ncbi:hypothetical protein DID88_005214 [Monilinia fructigena]|uniref:Uncharacterized protein n=1 Tax=Monilinia fructigena TaxID=38457 RepID=A0A395IDA6_9HELO|nr:hypothetical protein DID88_005214 [Monilinia fructigena]